MSHLYHLQLNVNFKKNSEFYGDMMEQLGWTFNFADDDMSGYKDPNGTDLWFIDAQKQEDFDYDKYGVNHISIKVDSIKEVDDFAEFLKVKDIKPLFGTPLHRPEFANSEKETYYQVMFESPDKILFEIVYTGIK